MARKKSILVCINPRSGGPACIGEQSREVFRALRKRAKERAQAGDGEVTIERNVCMGYCSHGPNIKILGGPFQHEVTVDDVDRLLDLALQGN